ncbi:MAG TPA: hypothetical protein DF715_00135, partial [Oceanicaulis sp.]|nr:hypothetical protein [Oceanicaulis sp.]
TGATTINKLCGSGMRATMFCHDMLKAGSHDIVVSGGMESMSNAPYILDKARGGYRMGHGQVADHMFLDGLEDAETGRLMGAFAQDVADQRGISREQMDNFAIESLKRAQAAIDNGWFADEIVPVTVKTRIGIDDQDDFPFLQRFVRHMDEAGCRSLTIHARKAILDGLSPKENRDIPPLDYEIVRRLKAARPDLEIILNGGLADIAHAKAEMTGLDGVMLGRAAYHTPFILSRVDSVFFGEADPYDDPFAVVEAYRPYVESQLGKGVRLHAITRHMLGQFTGMPGARRWRQILSTEANRDGAGWHVVERALSAVREARAAA